VVVLVLVLVPQCNNEQVTVRLQTQTISNWNVMTVLQSLKQVVVASIQSSTMLLRLLNGNQLPTIH
jgi:hypothetical protein